MLRALTSGGSSRIRVDITVVEALSAVMLVTLLAATLAGGRRKPAAEGSLASSLREAVVLTARR